MKRQKTIEEMTYCAGRVAMWMMSRGYATGHGDTVENLLGELEAQARERGATSMHENKTKGIRADQKPEKPSV